MNTMIASALCVSLVVFPLSNSQAAAKVFKNCIELNKIYPGGVALPGAINTGGLTTQVPRYDKALYMANKKSDRDKDGIACEK
jgi:Excalibur calcium-binding domain